MSTEARLRKGGKALARAMEARRQAADALADVVRQAAAEGMTEVAIARTAGVDRMTVRRYLGKK